MKSKPGLTEAEAVSFHKRCDCDMKYDSNIVIDLQSKKIMKESGWIKNAVIENNIMYIKLED